MGEGSERFFLEEDINPWELLAPILKNRWEIALIVSCSLLVGVLYNLYATPIYKAQSSNVIRQFAPRSSHREIQNDFASGR